MAVVVDDSGNVYVTGRSANTTSTFECTTIKYDSLGNEKWIRKYHGPASSGYSDTGWGIAIDRSGNIYVAASSRDSVTLDDIAVLKYDANGNELWVVRYNGPGNDYDWPFDIAVDENCNVYVTGRSVGAGSGFDYITLKYDSLGNEKWAKRYNGSGNSGDEAYSIAVDDFGNVWSETIQNGIDKNVEKYVFDKSTTEYRTEALKIKQFNPDVVVVLGYGPALNNVLADIQLQKLSSDFITYLSCTLEHVLTSIWFRACVFFKHVLNKVYWL